MGSWSPPHTPKCERGGHSFTEAGLDILMYELVRLSELLRFVTKLCAGDNTEKYERNHCTYYNKAS